MIISIPPIAEGTDINASDINSIVATILAAINGGIDTINLGAGVLAPTTPTGIIFMYPSTTIPTGYLACDGAAISRTTYATLFAVTGTTYGVGDGSTTFNLPDLRGKVPVGKAASGTFVNLAATGGVETNNLAHIHATDSQGAHGHNINTGGITSGGLSEKILNTAANTPPGHYHGMDTQGSHGHNIDSRLSSTESNLQPYVVVQYIIKT
jgi:microcystin-dependent protein